MKIRFIRPFMLLLAAVAILLAACTQDPVAKISNRALVQVGSQVVTVRDFYDAFEIAKTAYPDFSEKNTALAINTGKQVLAQLTEQMLILERGRELNLTVPPDEIQAAVADIKKDFPEDTFDKIFLDRAVSYRAWEKDLRRRLLIAKVIQADIEDQISITPQEVADYYQEIRRQTGDGDNDAGHAEALSLEEKILQQLRVGKAQKAYEPWIESLKTRYPIKINMVEWGKIEHNLPS